MNRLFCVRDGKGKVIDITKGQKYTSSKADAKAARDAFGGVEKGFHVYKGPDHIGVHGAGRVPRMRRQPKRRLSA